MVEPIPTLGRQERGIVTRLLHRVGDSPVPWTFAGKTAAAYMRLIRATGPLTFEPDNPFALYGGDGPLILTGWHGQHFMVPFIMRPGDRLRALVSRSRDGDASAAFMAGSGIEVVRGSGGRDPRRAVEKGGIRAFLQLKKSLDEGVSIATIADISNSVARRAGNGVISLARASGRPLVGLAFASSHWIELKSWDRATIHLPFSRLSCVAAEPIEVPRDADDALMEAKRLLLENRLNAAMARAYAIVGRRRD